MAAWALNVAKFVADNAADQADDTRWTTRMHTSDNPDSGFGFVVFIPHLLFLTCGLLVLCTYYSRHIKPNEDKWARNNAIIPMSMRGQLQFGMCDCFSDCPLCCYSCCCSLCLEAETWYRAGWSQAIFGGSQPCQAYYLGWCMICCGQACFSQCWCCLRGALRGGFTQLQTGVGGLMPHDLRFGIQGENLIMNMLLWCCPCTVPCILLQEHRQMQALIKHPEFIADPNTMMGGAVGVQMMPAQYMMAQQPMQGQMVAPGQYPMAGQAAPGMQQGQMQYPQMAPGMGPGPMPGQMAPMQQPMQQPMPGQMGAVQMPPMQGQVMGGPPPQWGAGAEPFKG